jgi:phosphoglycerate-specific signal transduction histidine kinase
MDTEKSFHDVIREFRTTLQAQLTQIDADLQAGHITQARATLKHLIDATEDWRRYEETITWLHEEITNPRESN